MRRALRIDLLKGLLTLGMVLAHVVQLLGNQRSNALGWFSNLTNLVSFSGFLYCFGFVAWLAYLRKPSVPWRAVIRTALKCYVAFVLSGVLYRGLVDVQVPTAYSIARIALLRDMPPYSGFLLSFALFVSAAAIFSPLLVRITSTRKTLGLSCAVSAALSFLPTHARYDPLLGVLIGGYGYSLFPLLLYMPLFLIGIWNARHVAPQLPFRHRLVGLALCIPVMGWPLSSSASRFPPSLSWIAGSVAAVFLYSQLTETLVNRLPEVVGRYLNLVGQNVLFYLVLSNAVLFAAMALGIRQSLSALQVAGFYILLMAFVLFLQWVSLDMRRAVQTFEESAPESGRA